MRDGQIERSLWIRPECASGIARKIQEVSGQVGS